MQTISFEARSRRRSSTVRKTSPRISHGHWSLGIRKRAVPSALRQLSPTRRSSCSICRRMRRGALLARTTCSRRSASVTMRVAVGSDRLSWKWRPAWSFVAVGAALTGLLMTGMQARGSTCVRRHCGRPGRRLAITPANECHGRSCSGSPQALVLRRLRCTSPQSQRLATCTCSAGESVD